MTLQLDKLPLSIEYNGKVYHLRFEMTHIGAYVRYLNTDEWDDLFIVERVSDNPKDCFAHVIDRALTIIESKEWEK
jgi:hypothetical protein